ncbi:hypothetical protein, partial [Candidatus Methanarcanum hacksteinii]|uniref:hypothetical protein n=1 Tax=Candidatus Methanarcanum hacksteinii TaxID=2911857 RepID=UPI0037DD8C83
NITISKDTTIPKGIAVDASSSDVTVKDEATLTVADGGEFSARKIDVKGTLVVENNEGLSCSNIISDVSSKTETTSKYTNIYIALSSAQSGETVKITKKGDGNVILSKDAVIGTGVIVEVPSEKTLIINEGVKLTVNGTLYLNNGKLKANDITTEALDITGDFGTEVFVRGANPAADAYYAVVEVSGTIISSDAFPYSTYKVPGAYYAVKNKYYMTTIENAAKEILNAEDYTVDINGENSVGTVAFEGKDGKEVIINVNNGKLTAEKMTVSFGKIVFVDSTNGNGDTIITGTYGSTLGTMTFENVMVTRTTTSTPVTFSIEDKLNADDEQIV